MAKLNIVLHEPEIPANTGNIGRTCVATGTRLHLIEPLGFSLSEKHLKRAGMDYWKDLDVTTYENWEDFCKRNPGAKIYYATTKGRHVYSDVQYELLHYVWKRECGNSGGDFERKSGYLCADSNDRGDTLTQFIQFSCHRIIRGTQTESI